MSKFLPICVAATFLLASTMGALKDKVTYYEVLHTNNFHARSRRSLSSNKVPRVGQELILKLFNMTLVCHLYPRKDLFTPTFRLVIVDGSRKRVVDDFDKEQFLVGTCEGDQASDVHGYFSHGVFEGSVTYRGTVYGIEEAKRHLDESHPGELHGKMIAYRSSDIIWEHNKQGKGQSFCGASHADDPQEISRFGIRVETLEGSRVKRATSPKSWSTCRLIAVADYKFYRFIGGKNIYSTAAYIGSVMERVDAIYRSTVFNIGYDITGMGFEIAEIQINTVPTTGFNADKADWEPLKLLQMFGRDLYFKDFCVAHLFTHQQFSGNVLGLAYIAAESVGSAGGICSPTRSIDNHVTALNTGWSTTLNGNGDTVLAEQAQLVAAHGHNWGAEHDPDTDACTPSSLFGSGKYLMYAYSVNGYDDNNHKFSPCSRRDISAVLASKAQGCFSETPDDRKLCGNGLIDRNTSEECDAGYLGMFGLDPCCSSQCTLVGKATCSPVNSECCQDCGIAPAKTPCFGESEISCKNASYCTGDSFDCPKPPNKDEGAPCLDMGQCDGEGVCKPFCEARDKLSCTCDKVSESCQRCCRDSPDAVCKPYDYNHPLPNSRPCVVGYCVNGVCKKSETSLVQRLFEVFDSLSISEILTFFRNNIVGCVIVFSLVLWIPVSCCISYQDRKQRRGLQTQVSVDVREFSVSSID